MGTKQAVIEKDGEVYVVNFDDTGISSNGNKPVSGDSLWDGIKDGAKNAWTFFAGAGERAKAENASRTGRPKDAIPFSEKTPEEVREGLAKRYKEEKENDQKAIEQADERIKQTTLAQELAQQVVPGGDNTEVLQRAEQARAKGEISEENYNLIKNAANGTGNATTVNRMITDQAEQAKKQKQDAEERAAETEEIAKSFEIDKQAQGEEGQQQQDDNSGIAHPTGDATNKDPDANIEYWTPVTKDSSDELKSKPATTYPTEDIAEGVKGQPVNSQQFLEYLQDPERYTDKAGGDFARSNIGRHYLANLDKPSDQAKATETMAGMLNDPNKSKQLNAGETPETGAYVMETSTVGDDGQEKTTRVQLKPQTDDEKNLCNSMWMANDLKGGPEEQKAANKAAQAGGKNTPQPDKPKEELKSKTFDEKKYKANEELLKIGHCEDIPYFRVNGYSKIKFPNVWQSGKYHIPIMGLPPMRVRKDPTQPIPLISKNAFDLVTPDPLEPVPEMYIYDEDEQVYNSFLKLTIHPIDVEFLNGANGKKDYYTKARNNKQKAIDEDKSKKKVANQYDYINRSVVVWDVEYNFAVQVQNNNVTINHTNNYTPTGTEKFTQGMLGSINEMTRNIGGISNVGGGFSDTSKSLGRLTQGLGGDAQQAFKDIRTDLQTALDSGKSGIDKVSGQQFLNDLSTFLGEGANYLAGARVDLPDVWSDSSTGVQYQVTIELRTLCPDPLDIQYHKDILIPLYILYTLALPTDEGKVTYKTPPYIYCNLDKFFKIKLGAITNMSVNLNLSEVNFKRAPRHITVTLTIKDLYSVMKQDVWDENNARIDSSNNDTTDKDEFINNFVKYAEDLGEGDQKKPTINEAYYLTEYSRIPNYLQALEEYKKQAEEALRAKEAQSAVNAQPGAKQPTTAVSADTSKIAQPATEGAEKTAQLVKDGKKTNFVTSIKNAITGVTKGVKNVMAGVQKAIPTVKALINTGRMVMNTANGLKSAVKLVGQTANIDGILNGQFASSVGFAFSNVANAVDIASSISDACVGGGSFNTIVNNLGKISQSGLTNNLPEYITSTGGVNLNDPIRNAACTFYGLANMFGSTYANVVGLKSAFNGSGSTLDKIQSVFNNLGGIANGIDAFVTGQSVGSSNVAGITSDPLLSRYVSACLNGGVSKGVISAGEAASNQKTQKEIQETARIALTQLNMPYEFNMKEYIATGKLTLQDKTRSQSPTMFDHDYAEKYFESKGFKNTSFTYNDAGWLPAILD